MSGPLVDFVIGGAQKCGTTALWSFLGRHPEICMSIPKEVHFFDRAAYQDSAAAYQDYHRNFPIRDGQRRVGEATPIYLFWDVCPARIHRYNPAMQWILLLRDPAERAFSQYSMISHRGGTELTLSQFIDAELALTSQHHEASCIGRGLYSVQIERLLELFPPSQLLALRTEDLRFRHEETLGQVLEFLGVDSSLRLSSREVFRGSHAGPSASDRRLLYPFFAQEIERLERLLGWDLSGWKDGKVRLDDHSPLQR